MYNFPRFDFSAGESSGQKLYSTMQMAVVRAVWRAKSRRRSWSIGESVVGCQKRVLGGGLGGEKRKAGRRRKELFVCRNESKHGRQCYGVGNGAR